MNSACIHLTRYFPSAAVINILGVSTFLASSVFAGMCLYSIYKKCDPWTSGQVSAPDQVTFIIYIIIGC